MYAVAKNVRHVSSDVHIYIMLTLFGLLLTITIEVFNKSSYLIDF